MTIDRVLGDRDGGVSQTSHNQNLLFLNSLAEQIKIRLQESFTLKTFINLVEFQATLRKFFFNSAGLESSFSSFVDLSLEIDDSFRFLFPNISDGHETHIGQSMLIKPIDGAFNFVAPINGHAVPKYSPPYFLVSQNLAKSTVMVDNKALPCVAILDLKSSNSHFEIVERFEHHFEAFPNQVLTFRIEDKFGRLLKCDEDSFFMIKLFQ
jgi:hypothetical protein